MNDYCSHLDHYLLGDLSPADESAFAEHLSDCDDCRETIDEQRWIDDLLQASSQLETEVPPPHIAKELRAVATSHASFPSRAVGVAVATAAALLLALTWLLNHPTAILPGHIATSNEVPTIPETPHATFVAGSGTIAVPMESRHANVTIVRVYPTFQPSHNSKIAAFEPESNNLNNSIDFSNGG